MKRRRVVALTLATMFFGLLSCKRGAQPASVEEYVPGIKRWAGPYQRIAEPSVKPTHPLGSPDVEITIDAAATGFKPNLIKVKQNQVVKLILKGVDDGDLPKITGVKEFSGHGFHVPGYDIWITGLRKGVVKEIVFKATVPGTFAFECPVFCGVNHYKMRGKLVVEPQ
jgi:heme/copper-type cytochrome/quinol oxidase subunit 2